MAQAFCRLGVPTTIVEERPRFLLREERDAAQILADSFARDGMEVRLNTAASVGHDKSRGLRTDDFLRTSNRRIYAAGDVCLADKFNHAADASARIAVHKALLFGHERLSARVIPWCAYTDPEIAHVGLYVRQAIEKRIPVKTFTIPMPDVDRTVTDSDEMGFVKIHVKEGTDRILGATIVARHAGEIINEITLAMVGGVGLRAVARTIHSYGTQAEGIKLAADAYERTRDSATIRSPLQRWWKNKTGL